MAGPRIRPEGIVVPFGYPDYPGEKVQYFLDESIKSLNSLDISWKVTNPVISFEDVDKAKSIIRSNDFDFIVCLLLTWVEAPNVIATLGEFKHIPLFFWSHTTYQDNGETITLGAIPGASILREIFEEYGFNFHFAWGMPGSREVISQLDTFTRAAYAKKSLFLSRIGLLGYYSMGMYTGGFDHLKVRRLIGPEVVHMDQFVIVDYAQRVSDAEAVPEIQKAKQKWSLKDSVNDEDLVQTMKMYLALKKIQDENMFDAMTIKCQYELSRIYRVVPCVPLSMLGDSLSASCEGDIPLSISQLILRYISIGRPTTYGDVHDILEDGIVLGACGFATLSMLRNKKPVVDKHTALYKGLMISDEYKEGDVTFIRIATKGENYKMHILTGKVVQTPAFREIGCPRYPIMKIKLDGSVEKFVCELMSQHYAVVYGNYMQECLEFCKIMGFEPVTN
ncbi:MAG: hypothetical protein M1371_03290 [Actinobacteria bacterium]|nr:hypothetical protein [Actinomycetota bacterium]